MKNPKENKITKDWEVLKNFLLNPKKDERPIDFVSLVKDLELHIEARLKEQKSNICRKIEEENFRAKLLDSQIWVKLDDVIKSLNQNLKLEETMQKNRKLYRLPTKAQLGGLRFGQFLVINNQINDAALFLIENKDLEDTINKEIEKNDKTRNKTNPNGS